MKLPIRVTLTSWYLLVLTLLLGSFGAIFYERVAGNLDHEMNLRLTSRADRVSETLYVFWRGEWQALRQAAAATHQGAGAPPGNAATFEEEIFRGGLFRLANRWAHESGALESVAPPFRILSDTGQIVTVHRAFAPQENETSVLIPDQANKGFTSYQTAAIAGVRCRLATKPVVRSGQLLFFVQTFEPLAPLERSLADLRGWLWIVFPGILLAAGVVGWWLAGLALAPVRRITEKARRISAGRLDERVEIEETRDEVETLARTFNQMLSRLERAFRRLRQFSAAASHELRTPLTVMKGELEVTLRRTRRPEEYEAALRTQLDAVSEMESVVSQLLMVAHAEDGESSIGREPLDLVALVASVGEDWRPIFESKKLLFSLGARSTPRILADRGLLTRLLHNLFENACKHTPEGGRVEAELTNTSSSAVLKVRDTGMGIPAEELPKVFDKFFSRRGNISGGGSVGLGLGLCRWIAEAHQGSLDIESTVATGTTLTLTLPLAPSS